MTFISARDAIAQAISQDALPNFERISIQGQDYNTRQKIADAYADYQRLVDAGSRSWMRGDPYEICDWHNVFTPIESNVWAAIRDRGLPMWPQFPVGRYSLDFGNPVLRIAIECDGKEYHDAINDAERDFQLRRLGWRTIRVPGYACLQDTYPDDDGIWQNGQDMRLTHALDEVATVLAQNRTSKQADAS